MSLFADRLRADPIHQSIKDFEDLLATVSTPDASPAVIERFSRLGAVVERFTTSTAVADPLLIPLSTLTSARSVLAQATNEVNNYRSNRNEGHLDNASNQLDALLTYAAAMQPAKTSPAMQRLGQAIGKARAAAENAAQESEARLEKLLKLGLDLESKLADLTAEVGRQTPVLATEIAAQQERFRELQAKWDQSLRDATQSQEDRVSTFLVQTTDNLNNASTQQQQRLQELLADARKELQKIADQHGSEARAVVDQMEGFRDQASHILELLGASGVIGGYKQEADRSRKAALLTHAGALSSLIALAWLAWLVLEPATQGAGWASFAARALLFAILAAPATYFGRQAIRYDRSERANRRLELELSSVRPFIADLDTDAQKQVKLKLVDRLYAQPDSRDGAVPPATPSAEFVRAVTAQVIAAIDKDRRL